MGRRMKKHIIDTLKATANVAIVSVIVFGLSLDGDLIRKVMFAIGLSVLANYLIENILNK